MGCDQMVRKAYKVVLSDMGKDHQNHMAMEMVLKELGRLSEDGAGDGLEAKRVELIHGGDDSSYEQVGSERSSSSDQQQHGSKPSSPHVITGEFIIKNSMQDQLESARAEIGKIREENERLKIVLGKIMKDYQSLQMQQHRIMQQETESGSPHDQADHSIEEQELVSLTLGTHPTQRPKKEEAAPDEASIKGEDDHAGKLVKHGLILGFEKTDNDQIETPKNQSPRKSLEEGKDEEIKEPWPPSEVVKTLRNGEEVAVHEQPPLKKARVSVRARCDAPTMNDGCQWRKYGQKIAKGNPCPRAYYRCTVAPGCPVRKQVQRCAEDMSILITTYEGNHNHPLSISATAMASTTSAAACMLTSASSTSGHIVDPSSATATTFSGLHNLHFNLPNSSRSSPFYLSNHSISPSPFCPTITLDLTSSPATTSQLNRFPTRFPSSTSFDFTSNGNNNYLSYTKSKNGSSTLGATQPQDQLYPSYLQNNPNNNPTQAALTSDTIAAATKVLTSDPNFKSALAAAITSMISNGRREANSANKLKGVEQSQSLQSFTASHVINSCSPSFLSGSSSTTPNAPSGNYAFLTPPSQLSSAATDASASPMDIQWTTENIQVEKVQEFVPH